MTGPGSQVDPHDKMRARDVNKVAKGEQAPRPPHQYGTVSPPPPPSSTDHINTDHTKKKEEEKSSSGIPQTDYQTRHCYVRYVDYHR
ncbi:putative cytochrome c oxidase subunit 6b-like [Senna tora]|uniref:Putative cytochrome c oxidase subunit 6b-like n=1 Tax=Senna tora TaxID=362788 RepID=A0A834TYM7_9FABA|nr:putative cytochrome c oxidase subunit 6b-like [Senna tora]